jgi:hypothetical protein
VFECFHVGRTRFLLPPDHLPGKFQSLEKFGKLEKLEKLDQVGDVRPVNMSKFYVEVV